MKLHQLHPKSKIYCEVSDGSTYILYHHIDGIYSFCTSEKDNVINLWGDIELEEFEDGYKIVDKYTKL